MARKGKRYRSDVEKRDANRAYPLDEAVAVVKQFTATKNDQTIELCLHLGIDPKQADQQVRGAVSLPHGTGRTKRVVAFCGEDKAAAAKEAGAVEAGGEDLVKKIEGGWMEFDVAVASPDMMRVVSRLGRVLGPRGLMPSPKAGTVTPDVAKAVTEYAAGKVEFRNDAGGNIHVPIGKLSFPAEHLEANARHMIDLIQRVKPTASKGQYIKRASLAGTQTPGVLAAV
ncbi:MAG: 50S ribosomal protein L1 [Phycisphaeraceae bacterium]